MDQTIFTLQTHHTCPYLVSVHQTAPPLINDSSHLIAAYYSYAYMEQLTRSLTFTGPLVALIQAPAEVLPVPSLRVSGARTKGPSTL